MNVAVADLCMLYRVDRDCHEMRKDLREFLKDDLFVGRYHGMFQDSNAIFQACGASDVLT